MAPYKLREALGAAKDQTTVGLARVSSADDVSADLEVAIVRATAHGEGLPADDESHVQEILTLTRYSCARVAACVASVSRRLGRTRAWPVALKVLALLHRLLAEGDPAFEQEVFLATTRRGRRVFDMSRFGFHERAGSSGWDLSAFVRTYSAYLDDRLKLRMQGRGGGVASPRKWRLDSGRECFHDTDKLDEAWELVPGDKPVTETATGELIASAQQLKVLLDRIIECRPMGKARTNPVVTVALRRLVKESAAMYYELTEVMAELVDRFAELETPGCVRVHSVFTSLAKMIDDLDDFYYWCTVSAVCRPSDIPDVERVKQKKLDLMEEFIRGRHASQASQRSHSPPAPLSPQCPRVNKYDIEAVTEPATEEQKFAAAHEKNNPGNAESALSVVDDKMADFLNLNEGTSPQTGKDYVQNLALTLLDGDSADPPPNWVAFEGPFASGEVAQSTSRIATQGAKLGGGFDATMLDGMYTHAVADATATKVRGFAGSASIVATRPPESTLLALPPPPGADAAAAKADPFSASLAVSPPTYVQMVELRTRQRLLVEEQMAWQQYGRQRPAWRHNHLL